MEIVKRLEGSTENEDFDFGFEDEYVKPKNDSKKWIFITVISLVVIATGGYFGFKAFQEKDKSPKNTTEPILKSEPTKSTLAQGQETDIPAIVLEPNSSNPTQKIANLEKEIQATDHKAPQETRNKETLKKEVVIYTEVLAQHVLPQPTNRIVQKEPQTKIEVPKIEEKLPVKKATEVAAAPKQVETKKPVPKPITKKPRVITIKKGDTLALISQKYYGNSMEFKRIIHANKRLKSQKTSLKLGEKIIVPYLPKNKQRRFVTIKSGHSLAYLSKKYYGTIRQVQRIVDANANIKNKNSTLRIGQKVYIPR